MNHAETVQAEPTVCPSRDAEIVDGTPHVRMKDQGQAVLCRVSKDRAKYRKPWKRKYFDDRDENGMVRRRNGFEDRRRRRNSPPRWSGTRRGSVVSDCIDPHFYR